jgi:hypothetical protein
MAETAGKYAALLLSALTALPAQAQFRGIPVTFGDLEITQENMPQGNSWHGYCEYAFRIRNKSTERAHTVGLNLPFDRMHMRGDAIRELRRTMQVGANETIRLTLLQPDHPPVGGRDIAVFIDGQRSERQLDFIPKETQVSGFYSRYASGSGVAEPLLLVGARVGTLPKLIPGTVGMKGGGGMMGGGMMVPPGGGGPGGMPGMMPGGGMPAGAPPGFPAPPGPAAEIDESSPEEALPVVGAFLALDLAWELGELVIVPAKPGLPPNSYQPVNGEPVETWSTHWLAYTRYDGVVVTADELRTMPPGVRAALWQYVEAGGFLLVLGPADLRGLRGLSAVTETITDRAGWKSVRAGFGHCLLTPDAKYDKWDDKQFNRLATEWRTSLSAWQGATRHTDDSNMEFPVVEDLGIPVKSLFVLMFLFTLAIGPINMLLLSRWKRRIWLLWTTPAISLATCLTVFGFMLISEGWEGRLRTETLTLLDETTHRATTLGWTGVYSPLTPSEGLHFSYDTEVIPQRYFEGVRGQARSCTLDWSHDQHFASGWVEARVPSLFKIRKSEMCRERVTLEEADGSWSLSNFLRVDIRRFWFADDKGQMHTAENIAAGARARLKLDEREIQATKATVASLFSGNWITGMKQLAANPERYLRPGQYLAEVDESPFLEDALHHARKRKTHALIVGFRGQGE